MAGDPLSEINTLLYPLRWRCHRKGRDKKTGHSKYTFHELWEGDRESPARRRATGLFKAWKVVRKIEAGK